MKARLLLILFCLLLSGCAAYRKIPVRPEKKDKGISFSMEITKDEWRTPEYRIEPNQVIQIRCGDNPCSAGVGSLQFMESRKGEDGFWIAIYTVPFNVNNVGDMMGVVQIDNYDYLSVRLARDSFTPKGSASILIEPMDEGSAANLKTQFESGILDWLTTIFLIIGAILGIIFWLMVLRRSKKVTWRDVAKNVNRR